MMRRLATLLDWLALIGVPLALLIVVLVLVRCG